MTQCHLPMHLSHWRPPELSVLGARGHFRRREALTVAQRSAHSSPETLASRATADGAATGHAPRGPVTS
eukprot:scaffold81803_cov69-Phaeocystis_antarctica.AAC.6